MSEEKQLDQLNSPPPAVRPATADLTHLKRRWAGRAAFEQELSARFFVSVFHQWWKVLLPLSLLLAVGSVSLGRLPFP